jgi:hypothetical protein
MSQLLGLGGARNPQRIVAAAIIVGSMVGMSGSADAASHKKSASHAQSTTKAEPGQCKPTPDQASIGIRALQTELMVAGLKCSAEQWNNFTAKFKATIKSDADRLQALFSKSYGKSGATRMNAFVTQLANDASQRSNGFTEADYCKQQDVLFQKVLTLTGIELERFSAMRVVSVPAPVALCTPEPVAEATPAMVVTTAAPSAQPSVTR